MKNAEKVQKGVIDELAWDPQVNSSNIAVTVTDDGVVRLSGAVNSYAAKLAAEKAAHRIFGVQAVVEDIEVKPLPGFLMADERIATAAVDALRYNVSVPKDAVSVTVEDSWITLAGEVPWHFQRRAAEKAVRLLHGVKGVINRISVKASADKSEIKHRIEDAYKRSAQIDAEHVKVGVSGGAVTLSGYVSSWAEQQQAEAAAWSAPGVSNVNNQLRVQSSVTAWES
ncbi:MAG: BON domain-containing protein [Gemmatimonadota bacterium]